jgi:hypothetical protein
LLAAFGLLVGCSDEGFQGEPEGNKPPEIWLSSGPVEGDTTGYQVHFYWSGWDPDGEISHFEFVIVDGDPIGFHAEDTTGMDKWTQTSAHDSVFRVSADGSPRTVDVSYTRYDKTHTFFIRAVDFEGERSEPSYRSFTAWTLAPVISINRPASSGGVKTYAQIITFGWEGRDPIDDPANTQDPESVRYFWSQVVDTDGVYDPTFDLVRDINENFWRYDDRFSPWIHWRADGDSGRVTILGDDEILELNRSHVFAVQGKDEAGAVTAIFQRDVNVRQFIVSKKAGPLLTILEPFLGGFKFLGTILAPEKIDLPPGVPLNFRWEADASDYGGEIVGYRYGWDVQDLNNPDDWETSYSPFNRAAPERKWFSGTHTFYVEVLDNAGTLTRGQVQIEVISFTMERNLLWVDDYYSLDPQPPLYEAPGETNHDNFWMDICSRAAEFNPDRDVYDCVSRNLVNPEIRDVGRYKNIIWTYSGDTYCWGQIIRFTPESQIGQAGQVAINYLAIFLAKGGHLWTSGRSDRAGGLAASLNPAARSFPMSLRCEITGNQEGCEGDTSGVNSFGYKEYCVTMIDKINGTMRTDDDMPYRYIPKYDAMESGLKDENDPITLEYPTLPDTLHLWEEVTMPGRFFDPNRPDPYPGGLTYVEIYDPQYWMQRNFVTSQDCFHPMYRMRARNTRSVLNDQVIALWLTKFAHITPEVESGVAVAAKSFHFGFPMWFFNRNEVDAIVDVIFTEWGIQATP